MKILHSIIPILFFQSLVAQDTIRDQPAPLVWKWPNGQFNGQRLKNHELKAELYKVPDAIPYFKRAKQLETGMWISLVSGLALLYAGSKRSDSPPYNYRYGFSLAGIVCLGANVYFIGRRSKNLKMGIAVYNGKMKQTY